MRKERLGKFRFAAGFGPWPLWYRCSALRGQDKIPASLNLFQAFSFRNCISCLFKCDDLVCIDLCRIPVNKSIKSRLEWRKCSDLYETVSTSFLYACSLEQNAGKVYFFKFFLLFTLILENPLCLSESIGRRVWDLQTLLSALYRFHWIFISWKINFLVYNFSGGHVSIPQVTHAWHSGVSCCQCRRRGKSCQSKQLTLHWPLRGNVTKS